MNTELTVYSRMQDPLAFVREFGTEIALSKMFGCANEAQGKVLAMACMCEGENPIALSRKYHIIQNNLSMKADAMLAELRARGGKHKVIERTSEAACVEITYDGQTYQERMTWEDAQQERYILAKDGTLKDNWATPRGRRQMLWARVISEAVRTVAPEIVAGTYTPEETHDFIEDATTQTKVVDVEQLMQETAAKTSATAVVDDVVDVEATPKDETKQPEKCSAEQRKQLKTLFDAVGASDEQIAKALEKRGVKAIRYLTVDQATEMIETLKTKAGQAVAAMTDGDSQQPNTATSAHNSGPVGQVLIDEIKALLSNHVDDNGRSDAAELGKRIKEHLVKHGKKKIADLSHDEAIALKNSLETRTMELFFDSELVPFDQDDSPSG